MPGELNVNTAYRPEKRICPLCDREIDCGAKVKPYKVICGVEFHSHCLDTLKNKLLDNHMALFSWLYMIKQWNLTSGSS